MGYGVLRILYILVWAVVTGFVVCQGTMVVKIGALFTYNSVIGRVVKVAIEAAADDINADQTLLREISLKFVQEDVQCNVFMGSVRGTCR